MIRAILTLTFIGGMAALSAQGGDVAARFEITSVKRNLTPATGSSADLSPSGLTIINMPVRELLQKLLSLQDGQLVGGPAWFASERYDISARSDTPVRPSQVPQMIEMLLRERFSLAYHRETRVLPVYALVQGIRGSLGRGIRVTSVDCAARTSAKRAERGGTDTECGFNQSPLSLHAIGMDMASVAAKLSEIAGRTVVDKTELAGQYDLELKWADFSTLTVDPTADGGSLFTAVQEQLGLKLQPDRAPVEVLVIDSVERPTPD